MHNFWQDIQQGISLAPMEDVTDTVFRRLMLEIADPKYLDVIFSEFVSTDGLCHPIGHDKVKHRLFISDEERELMKEKNVKIVAQVWGKTPEKFADAIREHINPLNFDGIDINMGCPVPKITKQGGCSALIGTPTLAKELILAAKESKYPGAIKFFGYLMIIAALIVIIMGHKGFQDLISSLVPVFKPYAPMSGLIGIALGVFFIYAFSEKKLETELVDEN